MQTDPDVTHRDLFAALTAQHGRIKAMMADVLDTVGNDRVDAFARLCHYLALHEAAEEEVMHPVIAAQLDAQAQAVLVQERLVEEQGAGDVIGRLEDFGAVDTPEFLVQFDLLREAVQAHAAAEEERELPALAHGGDAVGIGAVVAALARVDELADGSGPVPSGERFATMHVAAREVFAAMAARPR